MSPAAQQVAAAVGVVVWVGLALLVAIAVGRSIKQADQREHRSCADCPHDPTTAGETVRGQFRAVIVPDPRPRPVERLDVYL